MRVRAESLWMPVAAMVYFLALCYLSYCRPLSENMDYFPDERWRIQLPLYFYEHGTLPTGHEEAVRMDLWGFSYANYPLMLTTLIGGVLMKLMSFINTDSDMLAFAARLVCIAAATAFAWFSMKIGFRLFGRPFGWIFGLLTALMPQVIFCGLYFNNDIVALAGGAMILYSWVLGLQNGWHCASVCLLSGGVVVVALSYYNAYSWILLSIVVYFVIWFRGNGRWRLPDGVVRRRFLMLTALAVGIVLCCIMPFFIRNAILNNGDFLGLATVEYYSTRYGAEGFSPITRMTPNRLGMSLGQMLTTDHYLGAGNNWLEYTMKSFIGVFGAMNVFLPNWVYMIYGTVYMCGIVLWGIATVRCCARHEYGFTRCVLDMTMIVNCVIVAALALQYSYVTDYQPQGRYILPLLLSIAYFVTTGWRFLADIGHAERHQRYAGVGVFAGVALCVVAMAFLTYYLPA